MFCKICGRYIEKGKDTCICGASLDIKKVDSSQYDKFVYINSEVKKESKKKKQKNVMNDKQKCFLSAYFGATTVGLIGFVAIPICFYGIIKGIKYRKINNTKVFSIWANIIIIIFSIPYSAFLNEKFFNQIDYLGTYSCEYNNERAGIIKININNFDWYNEINRIYIFEKYDISSGTGDDNNKKTITIINDNHEILYEFKLIISKDENKDGSKNAYITDVKTEIEYKCNYLG